MKPIRTTLAAAAMISGALLGQHASAAALVEDSTPGAVPGTILSLPRDYTLDTELVVHNWVLCVSRAFAEDLVHARQIGADAARQTYEGLKGTKSCGQFPELRVILRSPLYSVSIDLQNEARVFEALVNLSGNWASAFVVSGSLPD